MFPKLLLTGILVGSLLLFNGCQREINISNNGNENSVLISEIIKTSSLQYPAENKDFYYNVYDDYVAITKYLGNSRETVVIPDTINGLPVYVIGPGAFEEALLSNIKISKNVYHIGYESFKNCTNLKSVIFTDVKELSETIFKGDGVVEIGEGAFKGCASLSEIVLPDSVTTLYEAIFSGCSSLTKINVPPFVTEIPDNFCNGCTNLRNIYIGESVIEISSIAFRFIPSDACFYGKAYSAAAAFASENFFSFVVIEEKKENAETNIESKVNKTEEETDGSAVEK